MPLRYNVKLKMFYQLSSILFCFKHAETESYANDFLLLLYHDLWWPGDATSPVIKRHGINLNI